MEEVFPLTEQMNLLSETSRYAFDNLLATQFVQTYGTKSNAKISNNSNITNTNNTCNTTCSPLLSKKRQQSQPSFSRVQSAQGMEHSGTSKNYFYHENNLTLLSTYISFTIPPLYSLYLTVTVKPL